VYAAGDICASVALDNGNIVLALEVEPELCAVPEKPAEAHRGVG
jgi:hypothetical protein